MSSRGWLMASITTILRLAAVDRRESGGAYLPAVLTPDQTTTSCRIRRELPSQHEWHREVLAWKHKAWKHPASTRQRFVDSRQFPSKHRASLGTDRTSHYTKSAPGSFDVLWDQPLGALGGVLPPSGRPVWGV